MIDIERQRANFKNHRAKLTKYDNITILDFKDPNSSHYRIRFLFEEDYCRLHISGDLGELIATNYNNMTYEKFGDFVNNTGYFTEKINCHNRPIYVYDEDEAREKLKEMIEDLELQEEIMKDAYDFEEYEDVLEEKLDYMLEDFSDDTGVGSQGYDRISEYFTDAWEFIGYLGKESTGILDLYMLAFKLAQEDLKLQESEK